MPRAATKEPETGNVEDPRLRATRIRAGALLAAVKDVAGLAGTRDVIPILSHVLLEAGDGAVELTACDLEIWAARSLASNDGEDKDWVKQIRGFAAALPAKPLAALLAEIDGDAMVTLESIDNRVTIKAGRAVFKLNSLPAGDFPLRPPFPSGVMFEMPCTGLADSFAAVEHAISDEETRYYLNGVYLHTVQQDGAPQRLCLAATDGNRLARLHRDVPEGAAALAPALVHRRTVALLDRLLGAAVKAAGDGARVLIEAEAGDEPGARLRFSMPASDAGDVTVTAKCIDGAFPDYTRVIPSGATDTATIDRSALAEALKRVLVLAPKESRCIKAEFSQDCVRLSVVSAELGEAAEEVPCCFDGELTIGFNGSFWRDALAALAGDTVEMGFTDAGGPALLRGVGGDDADPDRFVQVLMPMRV